MEDSTIYDVVKTMVGDINPIGSSHVDGVRLENLKTMCGVIDRLMCDVTHVMVLKNRSEYSIKSSGEHAYKFDKDMVEALEDDFEVLS